MFRHLHSLLAASKESEPLRGLPHGSPRLSQYFLIIMIRNQRVISSLRGTMPGRSRGQSQQPRLSSSVGFQCRDCTQGVARSDGRSKGRLARTPTAYLPAWPSECLGHSQMAEEGLCAELARRSFLPPIPFPNSYSIKPSNDIVNF